MLEIIQGHATSSCLKTAALQVEAVSLQPPGCSRSTLPAGETQRLQGRVAMGTAAAMPGLKRLTQFGSTGSTHT